MLYEVITFLESISYLQRYDIPVIGINSGRLGFLANISKEEFVITSYSIHYTKLYDTSKSATSLAPMAQRGRSFRSWRASPR